MGEIRSFGELAIRRGLERVGEEYAPGQEHVRIIDPRPHRDRADYAALLNFVDGEGVLWDVSCMRYRDQRGWKAFKVSRFTSRGRVGNTHTAAALGYELSAEHGRLIADEAAAFGEPFPYEEPSEEERAFRKMAHALVDRVEGKRP